MLEVRITNLILKNGERNIKVSGKHVYNMESQNKLFIRRNLDNTLCVACGKKFSKHVKNRSDKFNVHELMKCMFRIQASYILDSKKKETL